MRAMGLAAVLVSTVFGAWSAAMVIETQVPANLFAAGEPVTLGAKEVKGQATYAVTDFFGKTVAEGAAAVSDGQTTIELGELSPGWYRLVCRDEAAEQMVTLGVLMARIGEAMPREGRVAADTIGAGGGLVEALGRANIPWVRERLWWSAVQWSQGPIDWKEYPQAAEKLASAGVNISQVWHDSPPWTTPANPQELIPDDLRDLYTFSKTAAAKFAGLYKAWETGNEWDAAMGHAPDKYAAYEKAAYLGLKAGDPNAIVTNGSICWGATPFLRVLLESGLGEYSEVFNWHFYGKPEQYAWNVDAYTEMMAEYGAAERPNWISEGGAPFEATEGEDSHMSDANQRRRCPLAAKNVTMALAAGVDRYFFFCMPHYLERGLEFGLLRADHSPYPVMMSYAAAANLLGQSTYLGRYAGDDAAVEARAFSTPAGVVLAAWSDEARSLSVPTDKTAVRRANLFGAMDELPAADGRVTVELGSDPIYLVDLGEKIKPELSGKVRPAGKLPKNDPSKVVLMGYCDLPLLPERSCYDAQAAADPQAVAYTLEVYNFNEEKPAEGHVEVSVPADWRVTPERAEVRLDPMGREVLTFTIAPKQPRTVADLTGKIVVRGEFDGRETSPAVSLLGFGETALVPTQRQAVDWAKAENWRPDDVRYDDGARNAPAKVAAAGESGFRYESEPKREDAGAIDYFSYAVTRFDPPLDLSEWDGVSLQITPIKGAGMVRLMFREPNGCYYYRTISLAGDQPQRVTAVFEHMPWALWFTGDPNHRLDLDRIAGIKIGREGDDLAFEVTGFELIKLPR